MKTRLICLLAALSIPTAALADTDAPSPSPAAMPAAKVRIAVFNIEADKKAPIDEGALTDQVLAICGTLPGVGLVDRKELARVADEQKMSLSGLTDAGAGVKLGRFVAATHVLVGRLSVIGQSNYLILKLVDVETTEQRMISMRTPVTDGVDKLFDTLDTEIASALAPTPSPKAPAGDPLLDAAAWLAGKTVVIDITETHVNRPLADPASATKAFGLLRRAGANPVLPEKPAVGWKEALLATGHYLEQPADYLLTGEGVSSFAAELQGMTSCRARVELRLIPVPGRQVLYAETGVGAEVDLAEALAAKAALEEATQEALTAVVKAGAEQQGEQP